MPDEAQLGKGAADRPEDFLKPKAWRHEEIAGAFQPAVWIEKNPQGGFVTYPKRNQGQQSSCVAYVLAKQLAIDELDENGKWREMSPRSVYPFVAQPGGGSNSVDATKLATKQGMTLESLLPTEGLSEQDVLKYDDYVTDAKQIALVYKPDSFVESASDFETIASIIDNYRRLGKKKSVAITIIGSNNGTWNTAFPKPPSGPGEPGLWYHRVIVTDFGLINGEKVLAIDNSWGPGVGLAGQQFLTKQYEPLIYGSVYTLNQPDNWQQLGVPTTPPPKYQWHTDLVLGATGQDVLMLQTALQSMGFFPISSVVKPTGYYGGVTRNAVKLFQSAFGISDTGTVGPMTRAKLNSLFAV